MPVWLINIFTDVWEKTMGRLVAQLRYVDMMWFSCSIRMKQSVDITDKGYGMCEQMSHIILARSGKEYETP